MDVEAFKMKGHTFYSIELKLQAVKADLSNLYSQDEVCKNIKYVQKHNLNDGF